MMSTGFIAIHKSDIVNIVILMKYVTNTAAVTTDSYSSVLLPSTGSPP